MFILPCQAEFALIIPLSRTKYSIIWNISNVLLTSQALGCFVHRSSNLCCSALAATSICKVKYCIEVSFPYWSKWPVILWSYGPLLSVRCDCSDSYGPIALYCSDIKQSQGRVKPRNVAREWIWLIYRHSFPQWTLQPPSSLKWDVYSCVKWEVFSYVLYVITACEARNITCEVCHLEPKYHQASWLV